MMIDDAIWESALIAVRNLASVNIDAEADKDDDWYVTVMVTLGTIRQAKEAMAKIAENEQFHKDQTEKYLQEMRQRAATSWKQLEKEWRG